MPRALRFAAALLIGTAPLAAQEPSERKEPEAATSTGKWGIGITLNPTALLLFDDEFILLPLGFAAVMIPIRVSEDFILEPEFGMFRSSASSSGGGFSNSVKASSTRIGVGALFGLRARGDLKPYFGPRVGIIRASSEESASFPGGGPTKSKQTNTYMSAVLGAQYFFSRNFSLGGEAQLTYISFGDPETEPPSSGTSDQSFWSTTGVMTMRLYF